MKRCQNDVQTNGGARSPCLSVNIDSSKPKCMTLAQAPPGAQAPGSGYKGSSSPLGAWFTRLCVLSPTIERRAAAARGVTVVYESPVVWFSGSEAQPHALLPPVLPFRLGHKRTVTTYH